MTKLDKAVSALRTEDWPLDAFIPDALQLARHDDPEKTRLFGLDLLTNGQLHAVSATEDHRLISGHGRLLAARSAGLKTLKTNVFPASMSNTQFALIRASENFQRKDLSAFERWTIGTELMVMNPDWQLKDLAEHLHLSASMISKLMSPSKCIPPFQEALKAGKVTITDCYQASQRPQDQQSGLLALKLSGASGEQMAKAAHKISPRPRTTLTVKTRQTRMRFPEATVVVSVEGEMDMEGLIETLGTALEAAKKANKESLDIKTAEKVWADKARKA